MRRITFLGFLLAGIGFFGCEKENAGNACEGCQENNERIEAPYAPQAYTLNIPPRFGKPLIPVDNPLTVEGVELGRRLFFDPILSADSSQSCGTCHRPSLSFTDGKRFSVGVQGLPVKRNAMALVNLAFNANGFFWDGRSKSLEEQALLPIEDHLEFNTSWEVVERRLRNHDSYPAYFRKAFGIERKGEITRDLSVKAMSQFMRTLISADSRFDKVVWRNDGWFTDEEERGRKLFFFEELQTIDHPGCSHCHFDPLFTDNNYRNNGLDSVGRLEDFTDPGRGGVNGNRNDRGRFRVPTLRNIELTAPYMHDGRFQTLEEVLEHYSRGGHNVENEDVNIRSFPLSQRDKDDLIAFLRTLTDTSFVRNPAFQNPFR